MEPKLNQVKSGMPQGWVLGPLLLTVVHILIGSIIEAQFGFFNHCEADDTQLCLYLRPKETSLCMYFGMPCRHLCLSEGVPPLAGLIQDSDRDR